MIRCSCGGKWPCPKRRWWNRWRHVDVIDMGAWIEAEKKRMAVWAAEVRALTGERRER